MLFLEKNGNQKASTQRKFILKLINRSEQKPVRKGLKILHRNYTSMSTFVNALQNYTMTQKGERGHLEKTWSFDIDEKITQFFFQLVRSTDHINSH